MGSLDWLGNLVQLVSSITLGMTLEMEISKMFLQEAFKGFFDLEL